MDSITRSLHTRVDISQANASVTPIFQASAFEAGSPYFYTRKDNPNLAELEEVVRTLEDAQYAVAVSSGMAAIRICLERVKPGQLIIINTHIYGCTFRLVHRFCSHYNVELLVTDLSSDIDSLDIPANTALVFFETPTNPFLKSVGIKNTVYRVKRCCPYALIVVDNTWATSIFQKPLKHGADISLHSATKYMSGHSDVMGGMLLTDRQDLADVFREDRFYSGWVLDPHAAWLLRRSLQTIGIRLEHQSKTTLAMKEFLETIPQITRVYFPDIDGTQLVGYGGILFIELRSDIEKCYPDLIKRLNYFGTGTGMACVTSMIAQPYSGSHASMTDMEKKTIGLTPGLVRLCFGLEDIRSLKDDLEQAFRSVTTPGDFGVKGSLENCISEASPTV